MQNILHSRRPLYSAALTGYAIAVLIGIAVLWTTQAHLAGFSGADESSHFLNGVFVNEYLRAHFPGNPMAFAVDYYIHYPKISIGHWPPAYYGFLGLLFFVLPATPGTAMAVNLLVSALPAAAVAGMLAAIGGRRLALAGALIYGMTPLVLEGYWLFMLDQALTAVTVGAMLTWVSYVNRQTWPRALSFAALFSIAVLIKGNGWLLVFVPFFYLLLTGAWRVLAATPIYVAFALAAVVVVPWYWLTSGISADGFNYQIGLPYAWRALQANLGTLGGNLSLIAAPLVAIAVLQCRRQRHLAPMNWQIVCGCLSLIFATLALQSLVPVDIVDRYLAPALPAVVVLAVVGIRALFLTSQSPSRYCRLLPVIAVAAAAVMTAPGIAHFARLHQKVDMRTNLVVPLVAGASTSASAPRIYMIDGNAGAEGGIIAGMALKDSALRDYTVRASKLFAESNFMGSSYQLKFSDSRQVLAELQRLGVSHVVQVRLNDRDAFPHSAQLAQALVLPDSNFRKVISLPHLGRAGTTEIYQATLPVKADTAALHKLGTPSKANILTKRIE